eukprot:6937617-Prymnesium_polylepis.1
MTGGAIGPPIDAPPCLAARRDAVLNSRVARPARCQLVRYGASCVPRLPALHCFGSAGDADAPRRRCRSSALHHRCGRTTAVGGDQRATTWKS